MYGQQVLLVLPNFQYIDLVAQCMDIKLHNAWTSRCSMHGHKVAQCMDIKLHNAWTSSCTMHGHQVAQYITLYNAWT